MSLSSFPSVVRRESNAPSSRRRGPLDGFNRTLGLAPDFVKRERDGESATACQGPMWRRGCVSTRRQVRHCRGDVEPVGVVAQFSSRSPSAARPHRHLPEHP